MTSQKRTTATNEDALNAAQVLFTANPLFLAPQTKHLFQMQERYFDEIEKLSSAWFQRRQDAAQSMIDVGRRIVSEGQIDPADAMKAIFDWQTKSMERLAQDAQDCTDMVRRCAGAVVDPETEPMEEVSKPVKPTAKARAPEPV